MRHIALWLEYVGTGFAGFQRQSPDKESVQRSLETTLSRLLAEDIHVKGAGRTDEGVHAAGQVVTFRTSHPRPLPDLARGLEGTLDSRLRVVDLREVAEDFHPRFDAVARLYHYYILEGFAKEPFFSKRVWCLRHRLDLEAMSQAAAPLLGRHDFSAYCRAVASEETKLRDLYTLRLSRPGLFEIEDGPFARLKNLLLIEVEANAFLRRMVRQLVANLVKVGRGDWPVERPCEILQSLDPNRSAAPAPPWGLYLVKVRYPQ